MDKNMFSWEKNGFQTLIQSILFDWLGKTALQLATEMGYKAIADLLNEGASIQLNAKDGKKTI